LLLKVKIRHTNSLFESYLRFTLLVKQRSSRYSAGGNNGFI